MLYVVRSYRNGRMSQSDDFVFVSAFLGYSIGSAPIISFHFGAQNHSELHNLFRKSLLIVGACSMVMVFWYSAFPFCAGILCLGGSCADAKGCG